jgi:pyridoxal phosphate enzyme (YggS family)
MPAQHPSWQACDNDAMSSIADNLQTVLQRIDAATRDAGRGRHDVKLIAVSKTWPAESVLAAYRAGQKRFGESYLQEAVIKIQALADLDIEWHFVGTVQSNKTRTVAQYFDWVHSIERFKIARRLNDQRPAGAPPLNVCIQFNVSGENSKGGTTRDALHQLAASVANLENLRLRGLMALPAPSNDPVRQRQIFHQVRSAFDELREAGLKLDTLSMGMSGDLEAAIAEGATLVRVGTAIFGQRPIRLNE